METQNLRIESLKGSWDSDVCLWCVAAAAATTAAAAAAAAGGG